jgi:hypothetical protein
MLPSNTCRFVLFFFLSISANAEKGGLRVVNQSESTIDTSKGLAVAGADDAHRMLEATWHDTGFFGTEEHYIIDYADLDGKILTPGTYRAAAGLDLTGTLTFAADNVKKPKWTIIVDGALTTDAFSKIVFKTDLWCTGYGCAGQSSKVDWVVAGDITLGAGSTAVGNMETPAVITVGPAAQCGNLKAAGTLTLGAAAVVTGTIQAGGAIDVAGGATVTGGIRDHGACFGFACNQA